MHRRTAGKNLSDIQTRVPGALWGACPHQEHIFQQGLLVSLAVWRAPPLRCQAGTEPMLGRLLTSVWEGTLEGKDGWRASTVQS